jgi:hypothetical protein
LLEEEKKEAVKKKGVKSEVWRVKPRADDRQVPGSSAAPVNMVYMLPSEFMAPGSDDERQSLEEVVAQLNLEPIMDTFEKPEDEKHMMKTRPDLREVGVNSIGGVCDVGNPASNQT